MKNFAFLVGVIFLFVVFQVNTARAQTPDVTIIPQIISVNSSCFVKVDPKTTEKPMRITWSVYNTGNIGVGSFPITDGRGVCHFSNDDENATCGPSPFFVSGETEFYVYVVTPSHIYNKTIYLNVSSIKLNTNGVNRDGNIVYMYFYMDKKDWMKYSIYKDDLTIYQTDRPLTYDIQNGRYEGNITLNPGVYYFVFTLNDSGSYAGAMKKIVIPSGEFLLINTDKNKYWVGEKIKISGTTNAEKVSGSVYSPDNKKILDISIPVTSNNTFSYSFYSRSNWDEGDYEIRIAEPLEKTLKFSLSEFFEVRPKDVKENVNKSEDFSKTIEIRNIRENSTNISISTKGDILNDYVTIDRTILNPQDSASLTINIPDVEKDVEGGVMITSDLGFKVEIPISLTVVEGGRPVECPPCTGSALEIFPSIWTQTCVEQETISKTFTVKNTGDSELSYFSYEIEDSSSTDESLYELDSYGNVDIPLDDLILEAGESKKINISLTPERSGKYVGSIELHSGDKYASIFVVLDCFKDISGDRDLIEKRLNNADIPESAKQEILEYISNSKNAESVGNYKKAYENYQIAAAKIEAFESAGGEKTGRFSPVWIIIIIVIAVAIGLVWYFKIRKPSAYSEVEELEESF